MADVYVTLGEADNLRQNAFDPYIIPTILNMSPILSGGMNVPGGATPVAIPFRVQNDRTLTIVRESTEPTVNWYDPGEVVEGEEATTTQTSFTVRGTKTRIRVPREIQQGYSSLVDQVASQLRMQLKGMTKTLIKGFYYGDNATNSKEPSGLHKLVSTASPDMVINEGSSATGTALNLTNLDDLISRMKGGVDMLVCSREVYLRFTAAARNTATGTAGLVRYEMSEWGKPVLVYAGVPLALDDYLTQVETIASDTYSAETGGATSSIFALKFGPEFLHAATFSSPAPVVTLLKGPTQDHDGDILWVTWDVAFVMRSPYAIGRIDGITDAAIVA